MNAVVGVKCGRDTELIESLEKVYCLVEDVIREANIDWSIGSVYKLIVSDPVDGCNGVRVEWCKCFAL